MSLKTISLISLVILSLVFVVSVINLYSYLTAEYEYITVSAFEKACRIINTLMWLPFILFFWKIYKG